MRAVICASPDYLRMHGEPETPGDLSGHRCLVYSNLADPYNWIYTERDGNPRTVEVNTVMSASSGDFPASAAANGLGLVMQPTFIASELIRHGKLVPVLTAYAWPSSPAYAVYPPTRHLSYRMSAFIDFLARRFSGLFRRRSAGGICSQA